MDACTPVTKETTTSKGKDPNTQDTGGKPASKSTTSYAVTAKWKTDRKLEDIRPSCELRSHIFIQVEPWCIAFGKPRFLLMILPTTLPARMICCASMERFLYSFPSATDRIFSFGSHLWKVIDFGFRGKHLHGGASSVLGNILVAQSCHSIVRKLCVFLGGSCISATPFHYVKIMRTAKHMPTIAMLKIVTMKRSTSEQRRMTPFHVPHELSMLS